MREFVSATAQRRVPNAHYRVARRSNCLDLAVAQALFASERDVLTPLVGSGCVAGGPKDQDLAVAAGNCPVIEQCSSESQPGQCNVGMVGDGGIDFWDIGAITLAAADDFSLRLSCRCRVYQGDSLS